MKGVPVSVIVPVLDRKDLIRRCLDSVKAQTYRPINLYVVDNGSTDGTVAAVEKWISANREPALNALLLIEPKRGVSAARNRGLSVSDDSHVFFMDSDDAMRPGLLEAAMNEFRSDPDTDIVYWRCLRHTLSGSAGLSRFSKENIFERHFYNALLTTVCYGVRRDFLEKCGSWDESLTAWVDWELGVRLLLNGAKTRGINAPLVDVYAQQESITGTDFYSRAGVWERSLEAVAEDIRNLASPEQKRRMLGMTAYRQTVLAAHYRNERHREAGDLLFEKTLRDYAVSKHKRLLLRMIYLYTAAGGRGAYLLWK